MMLLQLKIFIFFRYQIFNIYSCTFRFILKTDQCGAFKILLYVILIILLIIFSNDPYLFPLKSLQYLCNLVIIPFELAIEILNHVSNLCYCHFQISLWRSFYLSFNVYIYFSIYLITEIVSIKKSIVLSKDGNCSLLHWNLSSYQYKN